MPLTTFVGPTATLIYDPKTVVGVPNATIVNAGSTTLYLGQAAVTESSGYPLTAGNTLEYPANLPALYAVSASKTTASPTTTLTAAAAAGDTTLTVAAGTSFTAGMIITIGTGTAAETATVASSTSTTIVITTGLVFDHASGEAVTADAAPTSEIGGGSVQVYRGGR